MYLMMVMCGYVWYVWISMYGMCVCVVFDMRDIW